jgi:cysteine synthase B
MGVSRFLKDQRREIAIVGCQPSEGLNIPASGAGRRNTCRDLEPERVDRLIDVTQLDAERTARRRPPRRRVLRVSLEGPVAAALCRELAAAGRDGTVVTIICDRGDRYLSSPLFHGAGRGWSER